MSSTVLIDTTVAPLAAAIAAVASVERSSSTISSSTNPCWSISSERIMATNGPIVSASFLHGMHTLTVRPRFAASASAIENLEASKVRTALTWLRVDALIGNNLLLRGTVCRGQRVAGLAQRRFDRGGRGAGSGPGHDDARSGRQRYRPRRPGQHRRGHRRGVGNRM